MLPTGTSLKIKKTLIYGLGVYVFSDYFVSYARVKIVKRLEYQRRKMK